MLHFFANLKHLFLHDLHLTDGYHVFRKSISPRGNCKSVFQKLPIWKLRVFLVSLFCRGLFPSPNFKKIRHVITIMSSFEFMCLLATAFYFHEFGNEEKGIIKKQANFIRIDFMMYQVECMWIVRTPYQGRGGPQKCWFWGSLFEKPHSTRTR